MDRWMLNSESSESYVEGFVYLQGLLHQRSGVV